MGGKPDEEGKWREEGEGSIREEGACMGDCDGPNMEPDEDTVR